MKKINLLLALPLLGSIAPITLASCSNKQEEFVVTFTSTEGGSISGQTTIKVKKGTKWSEVTKPTVTENEDYVFVGWFIKDEMIKQDFEITGNLTITAVFYGVTPKSSFNFSYDDTNKTATIDKYKANETDVIVPPKVKSGDNEYKVITIADQAFSSTPVVNVWLTSNVKTLGKQCFNNCNKLEYIYIDQQIESLPDNCFERCNNLEQITIGQNIKTIGKNCFTGCDKLKSVDFENTEYEWEIGTGNYWQPSDSSINAFALNNFQNFAFTRKDKTKANFCTEAWDKLGNYTMSQMKDVYGRESFVGLLKTIKLNNHDLWVRVIGQEHDTIASSTNKANLTFELVNVVSDNNGKFLSTQWNKDTETNHNYITSNLYKVLNAPASQKVVWYEGDSVEESTTYQESCLTMLNKQNPELASVLKKVNKQVAMYSESTYTAKNYDTMLFPLSIKEIGHTPSYTSVDEGTTYSYWSNHTEKTDRIKQDIQGNIRECWLLSPSTDSGSEDFAWSISTSGEPYEAMIDSYDVVTFGFCI